MEHFTYFCLSWSLLVLVFPEEDDPMRLITPDTHTHRAIKTLEFRKQNQCYFTYTDRSIINTFLPLIVRKTQI